MKPRRRFATGKKIYDNPEAAKESLFNEIITEVSTNCTNEHEKLKELESENDQLVKYIEKRKAGHSS